MDDWKKSIQAMQRRDKALQSMKDLIKEKNDAVQNFESEISGIKKETKTENEKNAQLLD